MRRTTLLLLLLVAVAAPAAHARRVLSLDVRDGDATTVSGVAPRLAGVTVYMRPADDDAYGCARRYGGVSADGVALVLSDVCPGVLELVGTATHFAETVVRVNLTGMPLDGDDATRSAELVMRRTTRTTNVALRVALSDVFDVPARGTITFADANTGYSASCTTSRRGTCSVDLIAREAGNAQPAEYTATFVLDTSDAANDGIELLEWQETIVVELANDDDDDDSLDFDRTLATESSAAVAAARERMRQCVVDVSDVVVPVVSLSRTPQATPHVTWDQECGDVHVHNCLAPPCSRAEPSDECAGLEWDRCVDDYCGGCFARYVDVNGTEVCRGDDGDADGQSAEAHPIYVRRSAATAAVVDVSPSGVEVPVRRDFTKRAHLAGSVVDTERSIEVRFARVGESTGRGGGATAANFHVHMTAAMAAEFPFASGAELFLRYVFAQTDTTNLVFADVSQIEPIVVEMPGDVDDVVVTPYVFLRAPAPEHVPGYETAGDDLRALIRVREQLREQYPGAHLPNWPVEVADPCLDRKTYARHIRCYYDDEIARSDDLDATYRAFDPPSAARVRRQRIAEVHLDGCALVGAYPCVLTQLSWLHVVDTTMNDLDGIDECLTDLEQLRVLSHCSNPSTNGTLPDWLSTIDTLEQLFLANNSYTGTLSPALGRLPALRFVSLTNNELSGEIPRSFWSSPTLEAVWFDHNAFDEALVGSSGTELPMRYINLVGNSLPGYLPQSWGAAFSSLTHFYIKDNRIFGPVPESFAAWTSLEVFSARNCRLTGPLPAYFGTFTSLSVIDVGNNFLDGALPASLGALGATLRLLLVDDNLIEGELPSELGALTALAGAGFDVSHNRIVGTVPESFATLSTDATALDVVNLGFNRLSSSLNATFLRDRPERRFDLRGNDWDCPLPTWCGCDLYGGNNDCVNDPANPGDAQCVATDPAADPYVCELPPTPAPPVEPTPCEVDEFSGDPIDPSCPALAGKK